MAEGVSENLSLLPNLRANILASKHFIEAIRNPSLYTQDSYSPSQLRSNLGYGMNRETGNFDVQYMVNTAEKRYHLPMAIYTAYNHANLVIKGPYRKFEGGKVRVENDKMVIYDPMQQGFREIDALGGTKIPLGVSANDLARERIIEGECDLTRFFESPGLEEYKNLLMDIKAFNYQKDIRNCVPYCLFVSAMLYGLESGDTPFKTSGIKQFKQDFGVRILTKEEILPQPRVKIQPNVRIIPHIKVE